MWKSREQAEKELRLYDKAYADGEPLISDEKYDALRTLFADTWSDSTYIQEVGYRSAGEKATDKVRHTKPMLSLAKGKYELDAGDDSGVLASWKVDGVACRMVFDVSDAGIKLVLAATRGDGSVGQNITDVVAHLFRLPVAGNGTIEGNLELRGELFMRRSVFRQKYADKFANARNLVAGATQSRDLSSLSIRPGDLQFFLYDVDGSSTATWAPFLFAQLNKATFLSESIQQVVYADFSTQLRKYFSVKEHSFSDVFKLFEDNREYVDFEADGVVFRLDNMNDFAAAGSTAHHPKGAVAWKFAAVAQETKVLDVVWQTSRMGTITPVALLEPVVLSGATVSRVTLHNLQNFTKLDMGPGDRVLAVRRGDVIPHIEDVLERADSPRFSAPLSCPSCGSRTSVRSTTLVCENQDNCEIATARSLLHFLRVIGCDGLGMAAVSSMVEAGLVDRRWVSLFHALDDKDALVETIGPSATKSLETALTRWKTESMDACMFLESLGLQSVGPSMSKAILAHFGDLLDLLDTVGSGNAEELVKIPSVGQARAQQVCADLLARLDDIADLVEQIKWPTVSVAATKAGPLEGQVIVFTGQLESMGRSQAQARVLYLGGKAPDTVNKDTTVLVTNSPEMTTKRKKAEQLIAKGVAMRIVSEAEFIQLFPHFLP